MVSTRNHPDSFPELSLSPSLARRSRSRNTTPSTTSSPKQQRWSRPANRTIPENLVHWAHKPSNIILVWLLISLPLVIWDCGYVLLRPHTMPGGSLHWPLYVPYALYAKTDYMYGFPAWETHNGFTAAQGTLNVVETLMYAWYVWLVIRYGVSFAEDGSVSRGILRAKSVYGRKGATAALILFAASVMTLSKTVLYGLQEYYSGFASIGHNDISSLILFWVIPNGAWIVFPFYMTIVSGREILAGLDSIDEGKEIKKEE